MTLPFPRAACTFAPLPRRPRDFAHAETLTPLQRRALIGAVIVLHAGLACGLLQVSEVRHAAAEAAPMFVSLVAHEPAPRPVSRPAPPPQPRRPSRPVAAPVPATPPQPAPLPFVATPPPPSPAPVAAETSVPARVEPPAPAAAPAPAPAPRSIPASAVQYLEPPPLAYPRASRRAGEAGRVVLRVFIDAAGLPRDVQVQRSSGFARLDAAAATAVLKARFKPYSDHGQAVAGWALVPLTFDLET